MIESKANNQFYTPSTQVVGPRSILDIDPIRFFEVNAMSDEEKEQFLVMREEFKNKKRVNSGS